MRQMASTPSGRNTWQYQRHSGWMSHGRDDFFSSANWCQSRHRRALSPKNSGIGGENRNVERGVSPRFLPPRQYYIKICGVSLLHCLNYTIYTIFAALCASLRGGFLPRPQQARRCGKQVMNFAVDCRTSEGTKLRYHSIRCRPTSAYRQNKRFLHLPQPHKQETHHRRHLRTLVRQEVRRTPQSHAPQYSASIFLAQSKGTSPSYV